MMNAPHPANTLFRAIKAATEKPAPEFTRKLSYEEQNEMHAADPAKYLRYIDWMFAFNAPTAARRVMREMLGSRDHDAEYERDRT